MSSSVSSTGGEVVLSEEENFLKKHVAFFDRNKDGIIYPSETFEGLRAIGCGYLVSTFASLFINIGFSSRSRPGKGFSWSLPIDVKNVHLARHGSDSGAYDHQGRFVPSKFEEIFANYAKTHPDALTNEELKQLLNAKKEPNDRIGALSAYFEWKLLQHLCQDKNGLLQKDTVRGVYDGTLFEQMEKQNDSKKHS
ncbi:hypothetical protein AALP_AA2G136700 [Arabis alpina]|uniref:EF-hand domain-containing protein n=1 Tax=Arabis alpina TaxID=50452 RepID=A0A087HH83_ARAAL|nr:hypothetical protein AALP_AA2G136700 [Arabis alpina]